MTHSEDITFQSCGEMLAATIDWNESRDKPTVLFLHGSLPGNRFSSEYIAKPLSENGVSCLRFDYAGHGDSSGTLEKATLFHLAQQAKDALELMAQDKPLTVIGVSLGGGPALELADCANVRSIILIAPGAWSEDGYHASYQERSLYHLNSAEEAERAPGLKKLAAFTGRFLHIIGSEDEIINPEVTRQMHIHSAQASHREFVTIENAPHVLRLWFRDHPQEQKKLVDRIIDFITS